VSGRVGLPAARRVRKVCGRFVELYGRWLAGTAWLGTEANARPETATGARLPMFGCSCISTHLSSELTRRCTRQFHRTPTVRYHG
jgi:hypothetical protein